MENMVEIQWADVRSFVLRAFWPVVILGLVCGLVALGISFLIDPIWRAPTIIQLEKPPSSRALSLYGAYESLIPPGMAGASGARALALLKSNDLALQMTERQDVSVYIFEDHWDKGHENWRDSPPTDSERVKKFHNLLHIDQDEVTGLIKLSIEAPTPQLSVEWTSTFLSLATEYARQQEVEMGVIAAEIIQEIAERQPYPELRASLFRALVDKSVETKLMQAEPVFSYRVLSSPILPDYPSHPRKRIFALVGALLGGGCGLGVGYLRRR